MDLSNLIGSIIGGALGGSVLTKFFLDAAKDRWMASVKAQSDRDLELLKGELVSAQKALQSRLDHGTYVTQAQYDLELAAYQKLWASLSDLRERWRGFFFSYSQLEQDPKNTTLAEEVEKDLKTALIANDTAVLVTGQLAPFYEKHIQQAARNTTFASNALALKLKEWSKGESQPTPEDATLLTSILDGAEQIDDLIRKRLSSLRLL